MATAMRPKWTDSIQVQAPYGLIKGSTLRTTWDLREKVGASLFAGVGAGGSTSLTNGVDFLVRRVLNNDSADPYYSAPVFAAKSFAATHVRLINNASGYSAGASSFAFDGAAGSAVFTVGDILAFWGLTTIPTSNGAISPANGAEFLRLAGGTTTPLLTDKGCRFAKIDNEVIGLASTWNVRLEGGSLYELVWDYVDDAAGEAVLCMADGQTYDYDEQITV